MTGIGLAPDPKFRRRLSLQSRFMVYFGIVVVLLMSGVILVVEQRQYSSILQQTEMRGEAIANSLAVVVRNSLMSYDYPSLQGAADQATNDQGVSYVIILNKEGEVAGYSGHPERQHSRLSDDASQRAGRSEDVLIQEIDTDLKSGAARPHLDITLPVFMKNSDVKWGTIRVGLSLETMQTELARTRWMLLVLAIAAIVIVLVAARYFTSRIIRPLRELAEATAVIARDELNYEVEENLVGELGDLARSFNRMTSELRRSRDAVRYQNQHLENMVQERTAALREKARELERANAELKEVDRLKSDFLSNVSHELRTPLTSIRSFTEILRDDTMEIAPDEREEFLGIVANQAERLTRLISDLLDLSKIESGEFKLSSKRVDMNNLVVSTVETLRNVAADGGIELVVDIHESLPDVMGDADRLSQVLTNLIDNALKFTPRGGRIEARAHVSDKRIRTYGPYDAFKGVESDTPESGPYLVVEIHDTGIGIPLEHQQRIFEKFGQVGNVMTDKPEGTGLGLAISGNIMVQHGGALWVESAPGDGTSMLFSTPLMAAEEKPEPVMAEFVPIMDEPIGNPEDMVEAIQRVAVAKRVLVVDDDPRTISHFTELLEPLGYRAVGCHSGQQAIERARDLRPGCVVLDLVRLDGNGHEVLRMLRTDPETNAIPVVVLTRGDDDYRARELGAAAIVRKPAKNSPALAR